MNPEDREVILDALKTKGQAWIIAAMIDGSTGYHSPRGAKNLLKSYLEGHNWACERTCACFGGSVEKEIAHDVRWFLDVERRDPEFVKRLLEFVKEVEKLDPVVQKTVGLMYPTMCI